MSENSNKSDLLEFLLQKGVTPSFSFPLDVCKFVAEGTMEYQRKVWASTDQDLRVALSEYAPGRVLTINKEDYLVRGLFFNMAPDRVNRARHVLGNRLDSESLLYYNRCNTDGCDFVHKDVTKEIENKDCQVCGEEGSIQTKRFLRPEGFAPIMVPWNIRNDEPQTAAGARERGRSYLMKPEPPRRVARSTDANGRVELPAPLMSEDESSTMEKIDIHQLSGFDGYSKRIELFGSRQKDISEVGIELIIVNSGYRNRGFYICPDCGRAEIEHSAPLNSPHHRPYAINLPRNAPKEERDEADQLCGAAPLGDSDTGDGILLGARFRSDIISFRFKIDKPLERGKKLVVSRKFNGGLLAIKEALITEVQEEMKYVNREIGGGIRKFTQKIGDQNRVDYFVDIFLYDQVSGGAGLVTQLIDNLEFIPRIFRSVEKRLSGARCISGKPCSRACVGCLMDFRNKREHSRLDRTYGLRILKWLRDGDPPTDDFDVEGSDSPSRSISRIAESMKISAGSDLQISVQTPDDLHSVIVVESGSGGKIMIRPVSSITRASKDPIVSKLPDFGNEISVSDTNLPESGWIRLADLEVEYVPLVNKLRNAIGRRPAFS